MKYQILFPLKNNEKIFKTIVCCSRDWRLSQMEKGLPIRKANFFYHKSISHAKMAPKRLSTTK